MRTHKQREKNNRNSNINDDNDDCEFRSAKIIARSNLNRGQHRSRHSHKSERKSNGGGIQQMTFSKN